MEVGIAHDWSRGITKKPLSKSRTLTAQKNEWCELALQWTTISLHTLDNKIYYNTQ